MPRNSHHEHLITELEQQLEPVFTNSPQGIYLYLDDTHKICNQRFADMLGYSSIQAWIDNEYPMGDVMQIDQEEAIQAYMDASQKFMATTLSITWQRKDGKPIDTLVTMVPITYQDEVFILHFISEENR